MSHSNFKLTKDFIKKIEERAREMIMDSSDETIINIPGTKIELILVRENTKSQEKYSETIFEKINIDNINYYLSR